MIPINKKIKRSKQDHLTVFIYGGAMVGKTHFSSKFPSPVIFNTDGNIKDIDIPDVKITTWINFIDDVTDLINNNDKYKYQTIIIDLIEDIYELCRQHFLKQFNVEHESEIGFGKLYDVIKRNFLQVIYAILSSRLNVVIISHAEDRIITDNLRREIHTFTPALREKIAVKIAGRVDLAGWVRKIQIPLNENETEEIRVIDLNQELSLANGNRLQIKEQLIPLDYNEIQIILKGEK